MSAISDDKIAEIRERASIVDVVGEYVGLRKSGSNYQGICPFHGEKTPSFNVNPARGIFHCFGCGVGGDVFSFIRKIEGLSFPEAARFLAKRTGVTIPDRPLSEGEKRKQDERESLYRINELAAEFYRRILTSDPAGAPGRTYLEGRKVADGTAETYRLGFAPDRWDGLTRYLQQKKIPLEKAEALGLVRRKEGGGFYDIFRNRLLFCICDIQGRVIGFGGRVLDGSLPKYINSPESPIYRKSEVLFGINLARHAIREESAAIVVEGYFDHLALYQSGIRNVVATCGTALTPEHLRLLQRHANRMYTLFDSDNAGRKATGRAMELSLEAGFPTAVIELTPGDDPDSFIARDGADAFKSRAGSARPVFEWFIRYCIEKNNTGTIDGKVAVIDELAGQLQKIRNPVERDLYLREIGRLLSVNERALLRKLGGASVPAGELAREPEKKRNVIPLEEMLLALMGKYPDVALKAEEYGIGRLFPPGMSALAESVVSVSRAGERADWGAILDRMESPEERSRIAAILVRDDHLEEVDPLKMFSDLCRSIEKKSLGAMSRLRKELAVAEPGSPAYLRLLAEIDVLRNRKSQLS